MTRHFIEVIQQADGWWAWRCNTCHEWTAGFAEKRDARQRRRRAPDRSKAGVSPMSDGVYFLLAALIVGLVIFLATVPS